MLSSKSNRDFASRLWIIESLQKLLRTAPVRKVFTTKTVAYLTLLTQIMVCMRDTGPKDLRLKGPQLKVFTREVVWHAEER